MHNTKEEWKPIYLEGYCHLYEVSNLGRIKSTRYNTIKVARVMPNGYYRVGFYMGGEQKHAYLHRLIAMSFIPNPKNKSDVNHIDEDKANNIVENLEWATRLENCNHGLRNTKISLALRGRSL